MSFESINRRQVLAGLAAASLPMAFSSCGKSAPANQLVVGGLPVTCNLTLPVACTAKAYSNLSLEAGQPKFEYQYSKYSGWPEIKESLMALCMTHRVPME